MDEKLSAKFKQVQELYLQKKNVEEVTGKDEEEANEQLAEDQDKINRILDFVARAGEQEPAPAPADEKLPDFDQQSVSSRSSDASVDMQFMLDMLKLLQMGNMRHASSSAQAYPAAPDPTWESKE